MQHFSNVNKVLSEFHVKRVRACIRYSALLNALLVTTLVIDEVSAYVKSNDDDEKPNKLMRL